jgi:hypothetical protein
MPLPKKLKIKSPISKKMLPVQDVFYAQALACLICLQKSRAEISKVDLGLISPVYIVVCGHCGNQRFMTEGKM